MNNSEIPEVTLVELVDWVLRKPTIFFVGSGISRDYPASLVSSWEMLRYVTLPETTPPGCPEEEINEIADALPELYYEALIEFTNSEAAQLWNILLLGQTEEELRPYSLGPNSGHMALVYLAWRWRLPLITVNYDTMFERAADQMGLHPIVCHHRVGYIEAIQENDVAIWKVHGDVNDIESIRTTLYTITSLDASLLNRIKRLFEKYRVCFMGYSGRDIDLFPNFAKYSFRVPAFWLDPSFDEKHRIYQCPHKFVMVNATGTAFAHLLSLHLTSGDLEVNILQEQVRFEKQLGDKAEQSRKEAVSILIKLGRKYADQVIDRILPKLSSDRLLIHGLALANISVDENALRASVDYLNKYLAHADTEPWKVCRALIIQAHSLHELSRFIDSEACAREAYSLATKNGLRAERGHALASTYSAIRGQHLAQLGFRDDRYLKQMRVWWLIIKMVIDTVRIWFYCPRQLNENSTASQIRARWSYLGHISRITAILQGVSQYLLSYPPIVGRLFSRLAKRIYLFQWQHFDVRSRQSGYAVGVAIANRHIKRLSNSLSNIEYVPHMDFYNLMSASEQVLFSYDEANALLTKGKINVAGQRFRDCAENARIAGNKVVLLKALIGLYRCKEDIDVMEVKTTLASIQGDAYRDIESELLQSLESDGVDI